MLDVTHIQFKAVTTRCSRDRRRTKGKAVLGLPAGGVEHLALGGAERRLAETTLRAFGLPIHAYRESPLKRRVSACLRTLRVTDAEEALAVLGSRGSKALQAALNSFLIGTTYLYRDSAVFDVLREHILPSLCRRGPLSVLSAGCSDGAELYTMAALLGERGVLRRSRLLGVDIRPQAIKSAEQALYSARAAESLPLGLRSRFFCTRGASISPVAELRDKVRFQVGNLLDDSAASGGPWDIILCRNLTIYLNGTQAESIWGSLRRNLKSHGILVTGKAEIPPGFDKRAPCIYQLTGNLK